MQSITDLQNSLSSLQDMISQNINPVFSDLQNGSHVFDPVIASHLSLLQRVNEMIVFLNSGVIQGLKGDKGDQGLQGVQGQAGVNGTNGSNGTNGVNGSSAYEVAIQNGYSGSLSQWLTSLIGAKGDQGIQGIQGIKGDQGLQGIQGQAGVNGTNGTNGTNGVNAPLGLLYETVVTGAAQTSITIPSLDIVTHKDYRIEIEVFNPTASAVTLKLYTNGDVTAANYAAQSVLSSSTTTTSAATADALIGYVDASSRSLTNANLSLSTDSYYRWTALCSRGSMTLPTLSTISGIKKATITNLTSLTLTASVASSIGIGSRIRIFRGDQ